ncbi:MAG: hypothetical protein MJE63_12605 [Proteobacteria bacterium]|nr:hypothetical protein [Pseudomonadota bacterium]
MKPANQSLAKCLITLIVISLFSQMAFAQDKDTEFGYLAFPILGRLAGIGSFYGLGLGLQNLGSSTTDITGAKTAGRLDAAGVAIQEFPLFADNVSLSAGYLQVDEMYFDISYTRAMEEDDPVTQLGQGTGAAFNIHWKGLEPGVSFNTTFASWDYQFGDYLTHIDEETIETPDLALGDLKLSFFINDLVFNLVNSNENPTSGFLVGLNATAMTSNTEFSSTNTANYFINAYLPVLENHTWVFRVFGSDTAVSDEKSTDVDEIKTKMKVDCAKVTDANERKECEDLRDSIANYLAAHNKYGTATPLGGNQMLRSYREMRFRGAHTRFLGTELRFNFPSTGIFSNYQFALFYERGTAADKTEDLDKEYLASYGAGFRISKGKLTFRLEGANGDEGPEWFLIAGKPW